MGLNRVSAFRLGVAVSLFAAMLGCVPLSGGWDVRPLADREPQIMQRRGQRLGDSPPYFIPFDGSAVLFLCRFSVGVPITVSLPAKAKPDELAAIRTALAGWADAGLGVRFEEVPAGGAMIAIYFAEPTSDRVMSQVPVTGSGYTVADCVLGAGWERSLASGLPLAANLERAVIQLRRSKTDMRGREWMLSGDELTGTVLHELGHALGFPGHVGTLRSVMTRSTDTVRRFGRRLRQGEGFVSPSLATLYALPSGTLVGRASLEDRQMGLYAEATKWARRNGWRGPLIRVGERSASLHWWDRGVAVGNLVIRGYGEALRSRDPLIFSQSPFQRALSLR